MEKQKKSAVYIIPHSAQKCKPESKRSEMRPVFFSVLFSDDLSYFFVKRLDKYHQIWYSECVPREHESGGVSHVLFRCGSVKTICFCTENPRCTPPHFD